MLKKIALVIICGVIFGGCSLAPRKSGIEIISYPETKVYLNDKEMGLTPYKNNTLVPGEIKVKLKANNGQEWTKTIELQNNSNTVIDWEFRDKEEESGGYLLYLEKTGNNQKAGTMINTIPDKATISVDGEIKGMSPIKIDNILDGDRQITIAFPGYKNINVFIKAIKGYQTVIESKLAQEKTIIQEDLIVNESTPSAQLNQNQAIVLIKETETGWLKVRETASSVSNEITKVKPNEKYNLLDEQNGWFKIDLGQNKNGWISSKYASKSE